MDNATLRSRGFTLIAALLLLLLMSGLAIGLMSMVNTEQRAGGNDVENSLSFRGAEAGIESMTSSVAAQFSTMQAPNAAAIAALSLNQPVVPGITFPPGSFKVVPHLNSAGTLDTSTGPISGGDNAGLYATLIKVDLDVTGQRPLGEQVRMLRTIEVALIPVFQFGIFSDSDLDFFAGPNFEFGGRIHTNGNLFLSAGSGSTLTLHDKTSAFKEVFRQKLANGYLSSTDYSGQVLIPTDSTGCAVGQTNSTVDCRNLALTEASKVLSGSSFGTNSSWGGASGISAGTYHSMITTGSTGAKKLSLPFVQGAGNTSGTGPVQIIRRPPLPYPSADPTIAPSRLYNMAQIRVMISDTAAENHPDGSPVDAADIRLDNVGPYALATGGVTVAGVGNQSYFAHANSDCTTLPGTVCDSNWIPKLGTVATDWPLIDGILRVETKWADGTWHPVTAEWLSLGFARGLLPPNSANAAVGNNAVHPNAILLFQELADRNADHTITNGQIGTTGVYESTAITGNKSQYNWFPINVYDTREGEVRDTDPGNTGAAATCAVNGVMNLVELDVLNLKKWLNGTIGGTGTNVDTAEQNGYVLYFSDRRGMNPDPNGLTAGANANNVLTGVYGFEDTINPTSAAGTPDNALDPDNGEDVDGNNLPDNWGAANVGDGFGVNTIPVPHNPYQRVACMTVARKNRVSGARHGLRLVNGTAGNLPLNPAAAPPPGGTSGGFTVASENPVYVLGDYNAAGGWTDPHAAAAVIADAVTLLSKNWGVWDGSNMNGDIRSFFYPTTQTNRNATETYFRLAVAAGKNIIFPQPTAWASARDYGTDGGMHNFLRYLEDWGGIPSHYNGSLVSLFYSQYATGVFKCCTTVYNAPQRHYDFDILFRDPANLPPGTPMFKDVNNLTYRQDFTPH